ncbi:sulfotransferase [Alteromonas ponticola]|uniref:Sulfotransferase n=1 Tax=Alteromonas aquimaris TaxID=2998417 RepID=A0ABT3P3D2_9ALTE|nr:sulfotransferase [Alteromonas aquimaris]MCW8107261.1 sulfotransferase [Alteromonas aquimaris]
MKGNESFQPVFVVGSARSGTTMIGKLLASHPLFCEYRAETLIMSVCRKRYGNIFSSDSRKDKFLADWFSSRQFKRSNLTKEEFTKVLEQSRSYPELLINFLNKMTVKSESHFIVDSTPANAGHIQDILKQFHNAKFIWMVRDGRDVSISQEKLGWISSPAPFKQHTDRLHYALLNWKLINKKCFSAVKSNVMIVRYEDFLSAPEQSLQEMASFLNTDKNAFDLSSALDPNKSNSAFGKLGNEDNRSPVARWRNADAEMVKNFTFGCSDTLTQLGYSASDSGWSLSLQARYSLFYIHIMAKRALSGFHWFSKRTSERLEDGD